MCDPTTVNAALGYRQGENGQPQLKLFHDLHRLLHKAHNPPKPSAANAAAAVAGSAAKWRPGLSIHHDKLIKSHK
jgi:hypothetical protein